MNFIATKKKNIKILKVKICSTIGSENLDFSISSVFNFVKKNFHCKIAHYLYTMNET